MLDRKEQITEAEGKEWQKIKGLFMNKNTIILSQFITLTTALVQTYKNHSKSSESISDTFDRITNALNTTQIQNGLANLVASKDKNSAQEILNNLVTTVQNTINGNQQLLADTEEMHQYIKTTTNNYDLLRGIAIGGPAVVLTSWIAIDYLEQLKKSLNPSNKIHLFVGGGMGFLMLVGLVLRATQCFGSQSDHASRGYICSGAEDETTRIFNNVLIEAGFLAAADLTMRFMNSCFLSGTKATLSNMWTSVTRAPSAVADAGKAGWERIVLWAKPGSEVTVTINDNRPAPDYNYHELPADNLGNQRLPEIGQSSNLFRKI